MGLTRPTSFAAPLAAAVAAAWLTATVSALDNGINLPWLGWSTWPAMECSSWMNETTVLGIADAIVASGLDKAGWKNVHLDGCWQYFDPSCGGCFSGAYPCRENATGRVMADPARFPHGMKWLSAQLRARGLGMGIYTEHSEYQSCDAAATPLCCGRDGGPCDAAEPFWNQHCDHAKIDAEGYADWNVTYIKVDSTLNYNVSGDVQWRVGAGGAARPLTAAPTFPYLTCSLSRLQVQQRAARCSRERDRRAYVHPRVPDGLQQRGGRAC